MIGRANCINSVACAVMFHTQTEICSNIIAPQYFATVSPDDSINLNNIPWLDTTVITGRQSQQKTGFDIADLANIVGSGEAVGGVVTAVVGGATAGAAQDIPQLQRIVARCGCEFYVVNFSTDLDPLAESMAPSSLVRIT
jgi:hypothetical protein